MEGVREDFGVFVQFVVLLLAGVLGFQCEVLAVSVCYVCWQVLLPEGRVKELSTVGTSL